MKLSSGQMRLLLGMSDEIWWMIMRHRDINIRTKVFHRLYKSLGKGTVINCRLYDENDKITSKRYLVMWANNKSEWHGAKDLLSINSRHKPK